MSGRPSAYDPSGIFMSTFLFTIMLFGWCRNQVLAGRRGTRPGFVDAETLTFFTSFPIDPPRFRCGAFFSYGLWQRERKAALPALLVMDLLLRMRLIPTIMIRRTSRGSTASAMNPSCRRRGAVMTFSRGVRLAAEIRRRRPKTVARK